jgi:hypothetical protein
VSLLVDMVDHGTDFSLTQYNNFNNATRRARTPMRALEDTDEALGELSDFSRASGSELCVARDRDME